MHMSVRAGHGRPLACTRGQGSNPSPAQPSAGQDAAGAPDLPRAMWRAQTKRLLPQQPRKGPSTRTPRMPSRLLGLL